MSGTLHLNKPERTSMSLNERSNDPLLASYRMGVSLEEFRWTVEKYYVEPFESCAWRCSFPSVNVHDSDSPTANLGEAYANAVTILSESGRPYDLEWGENSSYSEELEESYGLVCDRLDRLQRCFSSTGSNSWGIHDHFQRMFDDVSTVHSESEYSCRIMAARILEMECPGNRTNEIARILIEASPFGQERWCVVDEWATSFAANSGGAEIMMCLGRTITRGWKLFPSSFDPAVNQFSTHHPHLLNREMNPQIRTLLDQGCVWVPSLRRVCDWIRPSEHQLGAERIHNEILLAFAEPATSNAETSPAVTQVPENDVAGPSDVTSPAITQVPENDVAGPADVPSTVSKQEPDNDDAEPFDISSMLDVKEEIDPDTKYIGQSVPILEMFEQIKRLNQTPNQPLVILGPSGAGKTELAELIHQHSGRVGKFKRVSASDFNYGNADLMRERWKGHGANSGLTGLNAQHQTQGLLRECNKGTIFVDELSSMDTATAEMLRDCIDGKSMTPVAGDGSEFVANVRFIFATYNSLDVVKEKVPGDFFNRINSNTLQVPSLQERIEDIPLFVEKYRSDLRIEPEYILALLQHNWTGREVRQLIKDLEASVASAKARSSKVLALEDLPKSQYQAEINKLKQSGEEAGKQSYQILISILKKQGFEYGRKKRPLATRLAEIFNIDRAQVTRDKTTFGLQDD